MSDIRCGRCLGCGRIANTDEGEPWSMWAELPVQSAAAVLMGMVKPIQCPDCGGTGNQDPKDAEIASLRERVQVLEAEREAMEKRTWGWPKDSPDDVNADPESYAAEADYDDGAEFDWVVATQLRVEGYRVKWVRDREGNWSGNDIVRIDDAAKAMEDKCPPTT